MKTCYILTLGMTLILLSCNKNDTEVATVTPFTKSQEAILNSANQFGLNIFKSLSEAKAPGENIFISPLSISLALTMTYNGAANQTELDMQKTLGYGNMEKVAINQSCKALVQTILSLDPKVALEIANSIWYRNTFQVNPDFLTLNQDYFNAEVLPSNFNEPVTVGLINNWVKNKTHDKIDRVIESTPSDAIMYLINAIYFKGNWKYRFETKNTSKGTFYQADGSPYETDFMKIRETFKYTKNNLLSAIEMPYGNGNYSMVILLPGEGKTSNDIVSNLTAQNWAQWNKNMDTTDVYVQLPKFKFKYEQTLNQYLQQLGMGIAFDPNRADFTNINDAGGLYISFVLHKSFVDVNEEGTEAAAVTVVGIFTTSVGDEPSYQYFDVNKPFVFAIKENSTNSILFLGLVEKPVVE